VLGDGRLPAAFTSIEQTEPLAGQTGHKVKTCRALGGRGWATVLMVVRLVAIDVEGGVIADCGHFLPEERPDEVVRHIEALSAKIAKV
jgi:pimeloyl-ACP methyl ester carboxylesterase